MAEASFAIPNFLGGEISKFAQGRFDKPDYRVSLNVCLNAFPIEIGSWVRRPGTRYAGHSRGGAAARTVKFDFKQQTPYTLEFTDGFLRFRNGPDLVKANDTQVVVSVSAANPAVVQTTAAVTWQTSDTLMFSNPSTPLLENRQFVATRLDSTHFSLTDALTGASINGAALGALTSGATVSRVQELVTPYVGQTWKSLRAVQAETTDILLQGTLQPQALTVPTLPTDISAAVFAVAPAVFNDGPYLDPFTNGVTANPNQKTGIVQITLTFPTYDATRAYPVGAFVTSSSVNYRSLVDQNLNHTPASSPSFWVAAGAGEAINNGAGLLGTDIGRSVRLLSEPPLWDVATGYVSGNTVSYNPSGLPGGSTYWQAATPVTGVAPGTTLSGWTLLPQNAAIWTWGKITSYTNLISGTLPGSVNIGTLSQNGGVAAAFDGNIQKSNPTCAATSIVVPAITPTVQVSGFIGKNYSAAPQQIASGTYYPATDRGFAHGEVSGASTVNQITINMRAKQTAPAARDDGIILGTQVTSNNLSPVSIPSSDATTLWNYVWFEIVADWTIGPFNNGTYYVYCSQAQFFSPPSTSTGNGINVQLLGPALLYTAPIRTWRFGVYSNTTGWPTCGTYHEGRLWLGGAVANRFDASVSNGIVGGTVDFAPTDQYGSVLPSSAISYVLNSDSTNPIFWFQPDLQGILVGTQAGEWLVVAPTNGPIAPTNIAARRVTKIGCANVEPRRTDNTNVFVKRYQRKLMEYFADVYSGKFSAPNLADKAEHIIRTGIAEIAYTEAVTPVVWGRAVDGSLFGMTYKRDALASANGPTFNGWHRHALGSGRIVESLCSGPSVGGDLDTLTVVTNDTATNVRHIEVLTDAPDEATPLIESWFLDDAVSPSSYSVVATPTADAPYGGLTLNGLWHLNGKTVSVFAGGLDCGARLVTSGSCFVPFGDGVSGGSGSGLFTADYVAVFAGAMPIVIGFSYLSDGQLVSQVSPPDSGARNGPAMGKSRRTEWYSMLLDSTRGLSVGSTFDKLFPAKLLQENGQDIGVLETFSGVIQDTLQNDFTMYGTICWRVSGPYPANIMAVAGGIHTADR